MAKAVSQATYLKLVAIGLIGQLAFEELPVRIRVSVVAAVGLTYSRAFIGLISIDN